MSDELRSRFHALGLGEHDLAAWQDAGRPMEELDAWLTDRIARRPSGPRAREVYGADDVHSFAREAILDALGLAASDRFVEIGCGAGILLRAAAATGARVTGVDHSEEMVALARERAPGARGRRLLEPGGRVAIYTSGPELRGTPAAPKPIASHARFYADEELSALATEARFTELQVRNDSGGQLLTAVRGFDAQQ